MNKAPSAFLYLRASLVLFVFLLCSKVLAISAPAISTDGEYTVSIPEFMVDSGATSYSNFLRESIWDALGNTENVHYLTSSSKYFSGKSPGLYSYVSYYEWTYSGPTSGNGGVQFNEGWAHVMVPETLTPSAQIEFSDYDVYYGDFNGDGLDGDIYFHGRKKFVLIAGDIAIPFFIDGPDSFVMFQTYQAFQQSGSIVMYTPALSFDVEEEELQNFIKAELDTDYHEADLNGDDRTDYVVRGRSIGTNGISVIAPSTLKYPTIYNLTFGHQKYSNFQFDISDRSIVLTFSDQNFDGRDDIVLMDGQDIDIVYYSLSNGAPERVSGDNISGYEIIPTLSPNLSTPTLAGASDGSFRVNEQGAATYSMQILTPEGTAGVTPELGISYSSQGGSSLLGQGWNFNGVSAVTRCKQTLFQDGNAKALAFNGDDRFCLNGQRLILESTGQGYRQYRTEIDNFSIIRAYGTDTTNPDYFTVQSKDGSLTYFGNENGNNTASHVLSNGKTLTWSISRLLDNMENTIKYSYDREGNNNFRISTIDYAYGVGTSPEARIEFQYEDRPDISTGYTVGEKIVTSKRLKKIVVKNGPSLDEIRSYELYYYRQYPDRKYDVSYLTHIQECVQTECLRATEFEWFSDQSISFGYGFESELLEKNSALMQAMPMDINGDGYLDFVWMSSDEHDYIYDHDIEYAIYNPGTRKFEQKDFLGPIVNCSGSADSPEEIEFCESTQEDHEKVTMQAIDYNADGRQDLAVFRDKFNDWEIYLSVPVDGTSYEWLLSSTPIAVDQVNTPHSIILDFDSDGLQDILTYDHVYLLKETPNTPSSSSTPYSYSQPGIPLGSSKWIGANQPFTDLTDFKASNSDYETIPITYEKYFVQAGDFNADGRADVVLVDRADFRSSSNPNISFMQENYYAMVNKGDRFELWGFLGSNTKEGNYHHLYDAINEPLTRVNTVDVNGDGYTDVVKEIKAENRLQLILNNGSGFNPPKDIIGTFSNIKNVDWQVMDFNGDAYPDILYNNRNIGYVRYHPWNPETEAFDGARTITKSTSGSDNHDRYMYYDTTGDGRIDQIFFQEKDLVNYKERVLKVTTNLLSTPVGMIHTVKNGLGGRTEISYEPLNNSDHYISISDAYLASEEVYSAPSCFQPLNSNLVCWPGGESSQYDFDADTFYSSLKSPFDYISSTKSFKEELTQYPVLEYNTPVYVVTKITGSAPAGDTTTPGEAYEWPENKSSLEYYYSTGLFQAAGRGFLGFRELMTVDLQSQVRTTTQYRQDWPFLGAPMGTASYLPDGTVINKQESEWELIGWDDSWKALLANSTTGTSVLPAMQPYTKQSKQYTFNLSTDPNNPENIVANGEILQTVTTTHQYDSFGNATLVETVTEGPGLTLTNQIQNTYTALSGSNSLTLKNGVTSTFQEMGRLTRTVVSTQRGNGTTSYKTSEFEYYTSGDEAGLLKNEVKEPGNPEFEINTRNFYDAVGNKVRAEVSGLNQQYAPDGTQVSSSLQTRIEEIEYSSNYRYVNQTKTLFDNDDDPNTAPIPFAKEIVSVRNNLGQPTVILSGLNDIEVTKNYDIIGREIYSDSNASGWTQTDYLTCEQLDGEEQCPDGAVYAVRTSSETGAKSLVFIDKLAREMRKGSIGFDGSYVYVDTEYDHSGRVIRTSEPHKRAESQPYWTSYKYDLLGRTISTTLPTTPGEPLAIQQVSYQGNQIVTTNAKGHTRTEVKNGLGELVEVIDAKGRITYEYDDQNNLHKMLSHPQVGDKVNRTLVTTITYDDYGRKESMDDPDKGYWEYKYNAFGELVWQQDANNQVVVQNYDSLGRMLRRTDFKAPDSNGNYAVEQHTRWYYDGNTDSPIDIVPYAGLAPSAVVMTNSNAIETCDLIAGIQCSYPTYDNFGRAISNYTKQALNGVWEEYETSTVYDTNLGVVLEQRDALHGVVKSTHSAYNHVDGSSTYLKSGTKNHYNYYGFLEKVTDLQTGELVYQILTANNRGQVVRAMRGNGVTSEYRYDSATGQLLEQNGNIADAFDIQQISYEWDVIGNLVSRENTKESGQTLQESFCYDELNRLIIVNEGSLSPNCSATQTVSYDSRGNITQKDGVGIYDYIEQNAGPSAVSKIIDSTNGWEFIFTYDANGNMLEETKNGASQRRFVYSSFDKVLSIQKGAVGNPDHTTTFTYGFDRSRFARVDVSGAGVTKTTQYLGSVEKITSSDKPNEIQWKRYLGKSAIITITTDTQNNQVHTSDREERYVYNDHLGSLDVITDENGNVVQSMSFDAWGQRRNAATWAGYDSQDFANQPTLLSGFAANTTRGYTGHEMVDEVGIIHMNGRIYDPRLGRFLQADPFIQAATFTQSLNRYAYVWNNPLNSTDPSGYFSRSGQRYVKLVAGMVLTIASAIICNAVCGSTVAKMMVAAMASAASAALNGADSEGILIAAVVGAATAGIVAMDLNAGLTAFAIGAVGGIAAHLQGGFFGHGFMSAAMGSAIGGATSGIQDLGMRVGVSAIAGGTISAVTGGKFANGAVSAAFAAALSGVSGGAGKSNGLFGGVKSFFGGISSFFGGMFGDPCAGNRCIVTVEEIGSGSQVSSNSGGTNTQDGVYDPTRFRAMMAALNASMVVTPVYPQARPATVGDFFKHVAANAWEQGLDASVTSFIKKHGYLGLSVRGGFILAGSADLILTDNGASIYLGGGLGAGASASGTVGVYGGADSNGFNVKVAASGGMGFGGNASLRISQQGLTPSVGVGTALGASVTTTIGYKFSLFEFKK